MERPIFTTAAVLEKTGQPLVMRELVLPKLRQGQVLVEVLYSSICHTQINEILGKKGPDRFLPHTLGHEGSGRVLEIGPGVTKVRPDDNVVLTWLKGEGQESGGTTYESPDGVVNSGPVSTFLRYAVVSENRVVPIGDVDLKIAPLLGCAVPTGFGIVRNDLRAQVGSIAVFGCGGIGLSVLIAAKYVGLNPIIAVDIHANKLQLAESVGATHLINAAEFLADGDVAGIISKITRGFGADYGVECAGTISAAAECFRSIRYHGGTMVLAGNPPIGQLFPIDPYELIKGKRLLGSWGGGSKIDDDIKELTPRVRDCSLPLAQLVTHEMPLAAINSAVDLMVHGRAGRVLLVH